MLDSSLITKQDALFPVMSRKNETWTESQARIKRQQYLIQDDLLYAAIGWCTNIASGKSIYGFRCHKRTTGYVLLLTAVRRAFDLYRLPFCEDRILDTLLRSSVMREEILHVLPMLTPQRIDGMAEEVSRLYNHTQQQLRQAGVKTIRLTRRLNRIKDGSRTRESDYGHNFVALKRAATVLGLATVDVDMDALNSFGEDDGYFNFPIRLTLDIPVEDVLYCANLVAPKKETVGYFYDPSGDTEPGEWVIINRSLTGIVKIPTDAIEVDEKRIDELDLMKRMTVSEAQAFMDEYCPIYFHAGGNRRRYDSCFGGTVYQVTWLGRLYDAWCGLRGKLW